MTTPRETKDLGYIPSATVHSMKRRAPWHNYSAKGLYMVTLVVDGRKPILGVLEGIPIPKVFLSQLGYCIMKEEIPKINQIYSNVEVWKCMIMPDHIHMIIYVREPFADKGHLSDVVRGFKTGCNKLYRRLNGLIKGTLFESGFNDKILLHAERLDCWIRYLDDNPRRLWLKRSNPSLFTVLADCQIGSHNCSMVGNRFLLDVPDKESVIFHRRYTEAELKSLYRRIMRCGEMGGVLVSAAIAPWEKTIMRQAMNRGYRLILLRENGFGRYYKPSGEAFDACARGMLLQISPWEYHMERIDITREKCLLLNELAEEISRLR